MNKAALTLACVLPSTVCAIGGAWLCYMDREGWGWFLFAALVLYTLPNGVNKDEEDG